MRAPTCSSFNSLQKFCKWGLLLNPILCHTVCSAYSLGMLIFQQLFLYASQDHNCRLSTINLLVLCMSVRLVTRNSPMAILSLCQRFVRFLKPFCRRACTLRKQFEVCRVFPQTFLSTVTNLKGHMKVHFCHSIACALLHGILNDWRGAWSVLQEAAGSMKPVFYSQSPSSANTPNELTYAGSTAPPMFYPNWGSQWLQCRRAVSVLAFPLNCPSGCCLAQHQHCQYERSTEPEKPSAPLHWHFYIQPCSELLEI